MKSLLPLTEAHEQFRDEWAQFIADEIVPNYDEWYKTREIPRSVYEKAAAKGFLCTWADPKYGGRGGDFMYDFIMADELGKAGVPGVAFWLHNSIVGPYIRHLGNDEQKDTIIPQLVSGEKLICIMMTEPEHGSDLSAIETRAVKDGDDFVITGHKIYTTNGMISNLGIVAASTEPELGPKGISLFIVDLDAAEAAGTLRREKLDKVGFHIQDTSEIFFEGVRVPATNMLGEYNRGYGYLMMNLQQERTIGATIALGQAERCIRVAADFAKNRPMFGKTLAKMQNTQFMLADMATDATAARCLVENVAASLMEGKATNGEVSMAKAYATETAFSVADRALRICGGYAYCHADSEIGRLWTDTRVQCFSAGTTEVMKLLISREVIGK